MFESKSTKELLSVINKVEPSFIVQSFDFDGESQFFVFAKNPLGPSPGVKISSSVIVGMKQGAPFSFLFLFFSHGT